MKCPRCEGHLVPTNCEGIEIDECNKCGGDWLDISELSYIVSKEEETFSKDFIEKVIKEQFSGVPTEEQETKELCPHRQKPMKAINYTYSSSIIIDKCPNHGIWLDPNELEKVQAHQE